MTKPAGFGTACNAAMAGIGSTNQAAAAQRTLQSIGIGSEPVEGTAGNGAAGAAVDVEALAGKDVYISTEGVTRFRVNSAPTVSAWHLSLPAGPVQVIHLPDNASTIAGWGVGGAHRFVIVRVDQET